jgi:16S rRNA processing protein RimM
VNESDWLEIGRLGRVRGLHGELFVKGDQSPEWYMALPEVRIRLADGGWFGAEASEQASALKIEEARLYSGRLVFRFAGITSATEAEPFVNGLVYVSREVRPAAPEGEIWLSELLGCGVEDVRNGQSLGRVTGWQDYGSPFVTLEVTRDSGGEPVLVPFVKAICIEVNLVGRKIRVDPPDGLLDLNAGQSSDRSAKRE